MKFFWPILLVCVILCHANPEEKKLIKIAQILQLAKRHAQLTDMLRKLQDNTDDTTDDGQNQQNSTNFSLDEPIRNLTEDEFDTDGTDYTNRPGADYEIRYFYGFNQNVEDDFFTFNMLFSFLRQTIVRYIRMRLRIKYTTSGLRNLDDEPLMQSVPSNCTISDNNRVGDQGQGEDIDYECRANKISGMNVSTVNIDTKYPMSIGDQNVSFSEISFSESAASQAKNLTSATGGKPGESNNVYYRKSSSGLSGGAIAGIVIACVAVLIAAAVAAIMLRKPSPPIDNTTVVDLKQENI